MTTNTITFEDITKELPVDYEQQAYDLNVFQRARKIKTPKQLLQVVMCYCGVDTVLRETAGIITMLTTYISDTAVQNRLKSCLPWLKALLEQMWPGASYVLPQLRFVVIDGTTVQAPGAKGTDYRLHIMMDLLKLQILNVKITDKYTGESLNHFEFEKGDVVVADRGYNQPLRIIELHKKEIFVLLRLNPWATPLYKVENKDILPIDLYEILKESKNEICMPVLIKKDENNAPAWLHARRLPPKKAEKARRMCRKNSKTTPTQKTLLFCEWTLILTTVPLEIMSTNDALGIYKLRWQVEILIKRLKSVLDIDKLRAKRGGVLADVWLYGKLLYAMIVERRAMKKFGEDWAWISNQRDATWWRFWRLVNHELLSAIIASDHWIESNWAACKKAMRERPRKRKLHSAKDFIFDISARYKNLVIS